MTGQVHVEEGEESQESERYAIGGSWHIAKKGGTGESNDHVVIPEDLANKGTKRRYRGRWEALDYGRVEEGYIMRMGGGVEGGATMTGRTSSPRSTQERYTLQDPMA